MAQSPQPSPSSSSSSAYGGPERRQHPRVAAEDLPILLQGDDRRPLRIRDVSRAGVAFYSEDPIDLMQRVKFAIEVPRADQEPLLVGGEGVVVRCEKLAGALDHYEIAVFFQDLPPDAEQAMQGWIDRRLQERGEV